MFKLSASAQDRPKTGWLLSGLKPGGFRISDFQIGWMDELKADWLLCYIRRPCGLWIFGLDGSAQFLWIGWLSSKLGPKLAGFSSRLRPGGLLRLSASPPLHLDPFYFSSPPSFSHLFRPRSFIRLLVCLFCR